MTTFQRAPRQNHTTRRKKREEGRKKSTILLLYITIHQHAKITALEVSRNREIPRSEIPSSLSS
ncbi:uncharacterized protein G2W53_020881 [Senna tora]|uniref:Uncharacterized protein n=1 Tax=Senna tora TaxID=362788 RepID=A0A834TK25_9FABA|nr:uncharacterized protein G2W53_020881 [Senna tora]